MWETLCRGYSVNLQCEDSSCLPCGRSIAWFPQIPQIFTDYIGLTKTSINPLLLMRMSLRAI